MSDLTDFLLARIAEDEREARSLIPFSRTVVTSPWSARVLAECEAKRRIVAALDYAERNGEPGVWHAWWQAAELLALPYADHPDYRKEWRS